MLVRMRVFLLAIPLFTLLAIAGDKKKISLPTYVLNARTVLVLIDPDSGIPSRAPLANKTAQDDVEKAIMKWGRLKLALNTQNADLVITVRKGSGKAVQPTVRGVPINDRPLILQPTDSGIRIGGKKGPSPDDTQPPQDTAPRPGVEVGPSEDVFQVFEGSVDDPLERPAVWRYSSKDALHSPNVPAVAEFRKVIEQVEKQQKTKP